MGLLKDRAETLNQLAEGAMLFCAAFNGPDDELRAQHINAESLPLLRDFRQQADALAQWDASSLSAAIKQVLEQHGVKMPKLAIPLRVAVTGRTHTPAIDAVLALLGRETVLQRLSAVTE